MSSNQRTHENIIYSNNMSRLDLVINYPFSVVVQLMDTRKRIVESITKNEKGKSLIEIMATVIATYKKGEQLIKHRLT